MRNPVRAVALMPPKFQTRETNLMLSRDHSTGDEYAVPPAEGDRAGIERFLSKHPGKPVIVVQGLGFVGAVMALVCANAPSEDYAVIGVDLPSPESYWRIRSLNDGRFPVVADDPLIETYYQHARQKGNLFATFDAAAYEFADVIVVDINLDVQKSSGNGGELHGFDVNLDNFRHAMETIASRCREDVLILVETTVPPGTCKLLIKPIIDSGLASRNMPTDLYMLGHSYERVMPGPEYIKSITSIPRVYSGIDKTSADAAERFIRSLMTPDQCKLTRLHSTTASEMAKVLENSYRAMNIAFIVEWTRFAEDAGVNLFGVIDAIRDRETHRNVMNPGIGVGGYCLTKDPLLASWSRQSTFGSTRGLDMSVQAVSINDQMPVYAFTRLQNIFGNLTGRNVAILGVSYRGDVADTRYSPVNMFVEYLEQAGANVIHHDPYVSHWVERNSHIEPDLSCIMSANPDIVVICTGHNAYTYDSTISAIMNCEPLMVFDTIGLLSSEQIERLSERHVVKVIGRGDL